MYCHFSLHALEYTGLYGELHKYIQSNLIISNSDNSNFRLYRDRTLAPAASHCNRRENASDLSNTAISNSRLYRARSATPHVSSVHGVIYIEVNVGWWNATPHTANSVKHRSPLWQALMHCSKVNVFRLCIFPRKWHSHCATVNSQRWPSTVINGHSENALMNRNIHARTTCDWVTVSDRVDLTYY